jgi:hypothetical protein
VPIAGQISLGIDAKVAFTLATVLKVWDTGPGRWNFASSATVSYVWTKVTASPVPQDQTASNVFDLYFLPVIAGHHFSKDEHLALSVSVWAPTGKYDPTRLANTSLNNWTVTPQVAYTKLWPDSGFEFDTVAGVQFYTRNKDTDYHNAPLFALDVMGLKRFDNGWSLGVIVGTVQQLGHDTGPTAAKLDGFAGDATISQRLLQVANIGGTTFKVRLDGYNQLPYLTGKQPKSARTDFAYFNDDGVLVAYRHENWKAVFCEMEKRRSAPQSRRRAGW